MNTEHSDLKKVWEDFVKDNYASKNIRKPILESWRRCRKLGVNPNLKKNDAVLTSEELTKIKYNNQELIQISLPIMKNIFNFMSGSGFIVVLGSNEGVLLEILGDDNIVQRVKKGNFKPGVNWSEAEGGTNGVGTVLHTDMPLQIFSYEHFCTHAHMYTCSGAPIHDTEGNLIGVINLSGPYTQANPHTLGIAVACVNAIENELRLFRALRYSEIANNYKSTIINSINEGILAINSEEIITLSNESGAKLIGRDMSIIGQGLDKVFNVQDKRFLDNLRKGLFVTAQEISFQTSKGINRCIITTRPIAGCAKETIFILSGIKSAHRIAQRMVGAKAHMQFGDMIGNDPAFKRTIDLAKTVSNSNSNIMILGESGTGKDIMAQAIQNASSRRNGPFISINCASIPRDLLSSELFGYEDGAFTGARRGGNPGKFELADGGTIFLDEIGELSPESQVLLLRMLEAREVVRIGGKEVIPIDVRIIAATNRDLAAACSQGKFRLDLYYRLNVIPIKLPSLRERKGDIQILATYFIDKVCFKLGKSILNIDPLVLDKFQSYNWPGNVRELQNVIEHAVNLSKGNYLTLDLLPDNLSEDKVNFVGRHSGDKERDILKKLMEVHRGNITKVANELSIARSTLYRKLYKYHLND